MTSAAYVRKAVMSGPSQRGKAKQQSELRALTLLNYTIRNPTRYTAIRFGSRVRVCASAVLWIRRGSEPNRSWSMTSQRRDIRPLVRFRSKADVRDHVASAASVAQRPVSKLTTGPFPSAGLSRYDAC
jgi:hypothetical protein